MNLRLLAVLNSNFQGCDNLNEIGGVPSFYGTTPIIIRVRPRGRLRQARPIQGRQGQARPWTKFRPVIGADWCPVGFDRDLLCNATVLWGPWPRQDVARDSPAFEAGTPVPLIYSFRGEFRLFHDQSGPSVTNLCQSWTKLGISRPSRVVHGLSQYESQDGQGGMRSDRISAHCNECLDLTPGDLNI